MKKALYISLVFLSACFAKDTTIPANESKNLRLNLNTINQSSNFINLSTGSNENKIFDWQLRFENKANQWSILLNPLNNMGVHNTNETNFDEINKSYSLDTVTWQVDNGTKSALGEWGDFSFENPKSFKDVYLLSWNYEGIRQVYKLQILDVVEGIYRIKFGPFQEEISIIQNIQKKPQYVHTYLSLKQEMEISVAEPSIDNWDICLTYQIDSVANHGDLPYINTLNPVYGIYPGIRFNAQGHLSYFTSEPFDSINYFNLDHQNFEYSEFRANALITFNTEYQTYSAKTNQVLVLQHDQEFYAVQAKNVEGNSPESLAFELEIKQL